jgi:hypothetical protein
MTKNSNSIKMLLKKLLTIAVLKIRQSNTFYMPTKLNSLTKICLIHMELIFKRAASLLFCKLILCLFVYTFGYNIPIII